MRLFAEEFSWERSSRSDRAGARLAIVLAKFFGASSFFYIVLWIPTLITSGSSCRPDQPARFDGRVLRRVLMLLLLGCFTVDRARFFVDQEPDRRGLIFFLLPLTLHFFSGLISFILSRSARAPQLLGYFRLLTNGNALWRRDRSRPMASMSADDRDAGAHSPAFQSRSGTDDF